MTKILSARKPAVLGGLLFRWHEVPRRKKLYGITLKPGGDVVVRYNRITARRATFAGKPERDGRASLLAFIAALDASARSLRRDGCGDHTINARVLGQGVIKSLRTVHDEIDAAVGFRLYG